MRRIYNQNGLSIIRLAILRSSKIQTSNVVTAQRFLDQQSFVQRCIGS